MALDKLSHFLFPSSKLILNRLLPHQASGVNLKIGLLQRCPMRRLHNTSKKKKKNRSKLKRFINRNNKSYVPDDFYTPSCVRSRSEKAISICYRLCCHTDLSTKQTDCLHSIIDRLVTDFF